MGLHSSYAGCCRHRHRHRGDFGDSWCLWFWSSSCCGCNRWRLWQLYRLDGCRWWHRDVRPGRSLQCGYCDIWGSVSGLDTTFMKVSSCVAVDHAITGVHLVAVFWQNMYHSGRDPDLAEGIIHCNGLAGIQGCKRFASLSACDLEALEQASIHSWIWRAARLVLWILAGMVVLIWHCYRSSADDGSLVSMGVAQSAKRASCGSVPLYLMHWSACFIDFTHASANPSDCR